MAQSKEQVDHIRIRAVKARVNCDVNAQSIINHHNYRYRCLLFNTHACLKTWYMKHAIDRLSSMKSTNKDTQ